MFPQQPCQYCPQMMIFALSRHGTPMPVDPVPVVGGTLRLVPRGDAAPLALHDPSRHEPRWVAHFATCPRADQARKPKRKESAAADADVPTLF